MQDCPKVSIVICTRDREDRVLETIHSILRNPYPAYELLIIDQSRESIKNTLGSFLDDSRIHYHHSRESGLSRGRNSGIALSSGEIIAFTDDDCQVFDDWIEKLVDGFRINEEIQIVFGSVIAADHTARDGVIPDYVISESFLARCVRDKWRVNGMGACMAIRRGAWTALSGFDVCLGAGTPLRSAEENDFALRALVAGGWVLETPSACVRHHGFHGQEEAHDLVAGYMLGTGAMFMKQLRLRQKGILWMLARILWRWIFRMPSIRYASSHMRIARLVWFARGLREGWKMPLDRISGYFACPDYKSMPSVSRDIK